MVGGAGAPSLLSAGKLNLIGVCHLWINLKKPVIFDHAGTVVPMTVEFDTPSLVGGKTTPIRSKAKQLEQCGFWIGTKADLVAAKSC